MGFIKFVKIGEHNIRSIRYKSNFTGKPPWNILFFGTDEFSVYSLKSLYSEYKKSAILRNLEIVTTMKGKSNPVRKYADKHKLPVHSWPTQVNENIFDVGLVVSFGHLIPESVINQFHFGMLNVHASLLPRWRGAAPIIYSLANGDKETGNRVPIPNNMKLPELHETLGNLGAKCLVETLQNLPEFLHNAKPQTGDSVTFAPKVTPEFAVVRWEIMSSSQIYNLDRAVTGLFPLTSTWNEIPVKLLDITDCTSSDSSGDDEVLLKPGFVIYDKKSKTLKVTCANRTWITVGKIGVLGKKIISASDFNNGYVKKEPLGNRYFREFSSM